MANINDLFDRLGDVVNRLSNIDAGTQTLHVDSGKVLASTEAVKASVDNLNQTLLVVANNTNQLVAIEQYQSAALFHLSQQSDTMICILEHISKQTCQIATEAHLQTDLQKRLAESSESLLQIMESAYPSAALEKARLQALRHQVELWCPPPQPPPLCMYEPCPAPGRLAPPAVSSQPTPPR